MLHSFPEIAAELGAAAIHLPLPVLRETDPALLRRFETVGVSVHAPEEAEEAQRAGASYVTAGHIYATDCKKGLAGRGTGFLREVCGRVQIPVYAIGGITPENAGDVMAAGARGICLMSSLMQCDDPAALMQAVFRKEHEHGHGSNHDR
jgi:thiamine-phosphate pyrophosphorylase